MKKVWTPNGYQVGPTNSLVGKGESIINYSNGTGSLVTKGTKGVDNQPSSVQPNDDNVIAGNDIDWSNGMKFSDQIAPLTKKLEMYNSIENKNKFKPNLSSLSKQTKQLQDQQLKLAKQPILNAMKNITDRQEMQHNIENKQGYAPMYSGGKSSFSSYSSYTRSGKVPKYALFASRVVPALTEMTMLNHWLKNKPGSTDIYAANPYETQALSTMASNRVTPYPALQAINLENRKGIYNINQSGGYSGGQRQNARVAQNIGAQRNVANALLQAQDQNAKYRDQWAQAALSAGAQDAQRRQAANQYNWEAYNKAHGAKTKGIETHLANLGAMWQKYWADRIKNKQYEDILNIYQQDADNKKDALKVIYGIGGNASGLGTESTGGIQSKRSGSFIPDKLPTSVVGKPFTLNDYAKSLSPRLQPTNLQTQPYVNTQRSNIPRDNGSQVVYKQTPFSSQFTSNGGVVMHHNDNIGSAYNNISDSQRAYNRWLINNPQKVYSLSNRTSPFWGAGWYNNIPTSMYGINYNADPFFNKVMQWRLATPSNNAGYIDPFAMVDYIENIKR